MTFKVPGGVATTAVGLVFLVFIIALIGYHPDTRISLYVGFAWIVLPEPAGWKLKNSPRPPAGAGTVTSPPRLPDLAGAFSTPIILPQ